MLPMAGLDTIVAVKVDCESDKLIVSNTDPAYTPKEFGVDPDQPVDTASLQDQLRHVVTRESLTSCRKLREPRPLLSVCA